MDVVGVMAAYLPVVCVCIAQSREALKKRLDNTIEDVISAYTVLVRKPKEKTPVRRHVAQV